MKIIKKAITYFSEPGPTNTNRVIQSIKKRIKERDIKTVIVASITGETGLKFAKSLSKFVKVVVVSYKSMNPQKKKEIIKTGAKVIDKTGLCFHAGRQPSLSFYSLGQGFKVAIEVILIATKKKAIKPFKYVIGVGGTHKGSDTAIVARATTPENIFSKNIKKRIEIREIIAMPLKKKCW